MTKKEYIERNRGMTFDFIKQLIDHPEAIEPIRDGAERDSIDKDMPVRIMEQKLDRIFKSKAAGKAIRGMCLHYL